MAPNSMRSRATSKPRAYALAAVVLTSVVLSLVALSSSRTMGSGSPSTATPPGQLPLASSTAADEDPRSSTAGAPAAPQARPSSSTTDSTTLPPTALVVGDQFTVSNEDPGVADQSFTCQAVRARGWGCINESSVGSGYASAGSGGTFLQALTQAVTPTRVGLVVIVGGTGDRPVASEATQAAVNRTLRTAHAVYPAATVMVLQPFAIPRSTATLRALTRVLAAEAQRTGSAYVDTSDWFDSVSSVSTADGAALSAGAVAVAASSLFAVVPPAS